MSEFQTLCRLGELTEGEGKTFEVSGKLIALFLTEGRCHALDDVCPHMGASLSGGWVENGTVTCPWHAWRFRLEDGAWCSAPKVKIGCYPVRVVGDEVQVQVPAPPTPNHNPREES
ncbi:MAG: Rieske 2Fe-2S domain-containing protein [Gemmataceae bacterium]|nr:Rieske 2Fe-2S domain-containing protein [Gemmataceae bacterium]